MLSRMPGWQAPEVRAGWKSELGMKEPRHETKRAPADARTDRSPGRRGIRLVVLRSSSRLCSACGQQRETMPGSVSPTVACSSWIWPHAFQRTRAAGSEGLT